MKKDSFIVRREWVEGIAGLPEKEQLEMWNALFAYGLDGEEPKLKTYQMAIFNIIRVTLDSNRDKYDNIVEKRKEAAAKRWKKNMQEHNLQCNDMQKMQMHNLHSDNVNDNDSDNDNVSDSVSTIVDDKEKPSIEGKKKKTLPPLQLLKNFQDKAQADDYKKFLNWTLENTPYVAAHLTPLSESEFNKLKLTYGANAIRINLENLENRRDLRKNYTSLYRTLLNWLKNGYNV